MTKRDFAPILAYIATACGAPAPTREQAEVYYDFLKDLEPAQVKAAAMTVLSDYPYKSLPSVGQIRQEAIRPTSGKVPGGVAWALALQTAQEAPDPEIPSYRRKVREMYAKLPPAVAYAINAYGLELLVHTTTKDLGKAQHAFLGIYESMAMHEKHLAVLPPSVKQLTLGIGEMPALEGKR